jgi:type IV pilus assembly protein PilC
MLRSKVNLDQALELLEKVTDFYPLQSVIPAVRSDVMEGQSLYESFSRHKFFPPAFLQMIKVGEKTGKPDVMLETLAKNLEEESETGVASLTGILEPMLIVVLGAVVGLILISMYLPMFELTNTIK